MSLKFIGILPGIVAIGFVIAARILGSLQSLEVAVYDQFMRLRPDEPIDERILIVGINEEDIQKLKAYPVPDGEIAKLLRILQSYQPAAVGLDIYRDMPVEPGHKELASVFKEMKNLVGVEKVLPDISGFTVNPSLNLPSEQIGFVDAPVDIDGKQRRTLLGTSNSKNEWCLSFSLKLAEIYLKKQGINLKEEENKSEGYIKKFNSTKIPRFIANDGGYISEDDGGYQTLINFRSNIKPFYIVSLGDIINKKVDASWIRDKIVLIGVTAPSVKDYTFSDTIKTKDIPLVYGVEIHAHVTSQLISSVLNKRTFIKTWADSWEYLWIISWGMIVIVLGRKIRSLSILIFNINTLILGFIIISYSLFIMGWWTPFIPTLLILILNGFSILIAAINRYEENSLIRIQVQKIVINKTFDIIHNGPLQTIARIIKQVEENPDISEKKIFLSELHQLNQDLRGVYKLVKQENFIASNTFYINQEQEIDLKKPLHEALNEVYIDVLDRDFPCFKTIKLNVVNFQPLNEKNLSIELKQSICRFLEEALCNVGKYAQNTTRLEISCNCQNGKNIITVKDNGLGIDKVSNSSYQGFGTQQAVTLAKQLRGKFERFANSPKGTTCQLSWSTHKVWLWKL
ncbi:CHASE2 domain-containing protein [Calothrix sp. FACHB-1219]|uniref:sensor histidine kinase n=1 Tax=unclassified Calothrix TaxID=2619626 RepID=UPI001684F9FD|nr:MULTISPECIES: CHASE2 domain-containing protein [unclassified Calothrix]MBD2207857.1 CHASE2 domain-containing protein [Calothrix sp. FACHB-168]MBD2222457.1 CHASE2 domain-containing protein [Calothrix sp. FACHB-1219]